MLAIIGNINIDNSSTCARVSGRQEQCKTAINSVPIKGFCTYKGKYPQFKLKREISRDFSVKKGNTFAFYYRGFCRVVESFKLKGLP